MTKKILLATLLSLFGVTVSLSYAFAEDVTSTTGITPTKTKVRTEKQALQDTFKQQMQDNKEEMKTLIMDRKAAFQEKLATLKDVQKKATTERINEKLASVNANRTTHMSDAITRLTERLTSMEEKASLAKQNGKDTAALDQAIVSAKAALATATAAVNTQKAKDYTLTLTTEEQLRLSVGQSVKAAQADLRATHAIVLDAKKAVVQVAIELAKVQGQKTDTDTATESAI